MAPENEENGVSVPIEEPNNEGKKTSDGSQLVVNGTGDEDGDHAYSCCSWKPGFLQFLASGRFFCVLLCMVVASDAFNSGTFGSAVTSLETRYKLPSSQLGFINSMYELASLVLVLFVVYYGGKPTSNRPLWIGLGSVVMGIGAVVALLPQFLFGAYVPLSDGSKGNSSTATCSAGSGNITDHCTKNEGDTDNGETHAAFVFIICGQIIVGLGWTPVMALGMSYIDDNVKTSTSAMHIGYVQSMFGFGRIAGFLIGGVTVRKWVDYYRDDPDNYGVGPQDPQWVGAWWLGLIIASVSYVISGIPMIGFPRSLPKNYDEAHDDFMGHSKRGRSTGSESAENAAKPKSRKKAAFKSIKDMPGKFWEVCKNPLYLIINMAFVTEFAAMIGLNIFFPKYLETEFGLTSSYANLITGAVLVPAAALGSIVGGVIVKKFKTKAEGSCKVALVLSIVAMFLLLITFGVGCRTIPTAGVTTKYPDQSAGTSLSRTSTCNVQCGCNNDIYSPVCGEDGITYVSACHAGCLQEFDNGTFGDCSCVDAEDGTYSAVDGTCGNNCKSLIPFLIISFLVVVISGAEEIPQTLIAMRCVNPDSKAIALGVRAIMMRLLGAIPAPLIYGAMIDTACRLWQTECGKQGSCYVYDLAAFRYAYLGVNFIFKVLTVLFYVIGWWLIRRQRMRNQQAGKLTNEEE
ncbi:solute carrier organic anion transporter family member 2A1-like [Lytechinus variegatus]|uniref:solute carrier organic anion transporter family member 2A1-like n=1 Tax=Lytechinus variegatus TaxID=7654 RepID=UPI001BB13334|nr:solute carrier organic anion transporter family member 2A1-like [Lytechinus variegatus]XP_041471627.1 solute carrier organic anion transporter family member 2A1-like [Lytechinus variegatus]